MLPLFEKNSVATSRLQKLILMNDINGKLDYIVAPMSEDRKLIIPVINFELVQPICPRYINVTDGRTDRWIDGRTTYDSIVHRTVKSKLHSIKHRQTTIHRNKNGKAETQT